MYVLEDLYAGRVRPSERSIAEGTRYTELLSLANEQEALFRAELSAEGKKAYETFWNYRIELEKITDSDMFINGVRFGVGLILDVVGEYNTPLPIVSR